MLRIKLRRILCLKPDQRLAIGFEYLAIRAAQKPWSPGAGRHHRLARPIRLCSSSYSHSVSGLRNLHHRLAGSNFGAMRTGQFQLGRDTKFGEQHAGPGFEIDGFAIGDLQLRKASSALVCGYYLMINAKCFCGVDGAPQEIRLTGMPRRQIQAANDNKTAVQQQFAAGLCLVSPPKGMRTPRQGHVDFSLPDSLASHAGLTVA